MILLGGIDAEDDRHCQFAGSGRLLALIIQAYSPWNTQFTGEVAWVSVKVRSLATIAISFFKLCAVQAQSHSA